MTRRRAAAGAALVAGAVVTALASLALPWLAVRTPGADPYRDVGRAELLAAGPVPYEAFLLHAPLAALAVLALAGAALAVPGLRRRLPADAPLLAAGAAGLLLAVCAARWAGFYAARLADPGPSLAHLHAVPWLHLGVGLAALAPAVVLVRARARAGRSPSRMAGARLAGVAALGLLATPLLPLGRQPLADGWFHYDELTIATLAATGTPLQDCALALSAMRASLWLLLAAGLALAHGGVRLSWAALPPTAVLAAAGTWALAALAALPAAVMPGPNVLAPALALGAAALQWPLLAPGAPAAGAALR